MLEIRKLVDEGSRHLGLEVVDVRIKRVDLPEENKAAIFLSMQTQREQEARGIRASGEKSRGKFVRAPIRSSGLSSRRKAKVEILPGEGDAKATKLYNDAFGNDRGFPGAHFYRSYHKPCGRA